MEQDNNGTARAANGPGGLWFAPQLRLLVFDLDGTLIDSKQDLAESVNAALRHLRRSELTGEQISQFVGRGAPVLMERALRASTDGPVDPEELAEGLEALLAYYDAHKLDHTRLYPGVADSLPQLGGRFALAVLTNKPVRPARAILEGLGVANHFTAIYGGNSFAAKKPDPLGFNTILAEQSLEPRKALMVGDSAVDVQTGRNAGAWTCGVVYGFSPESFEREPPDVQVGEFAELAALLATDGEPVS